MNQAIKPKPLRALSVVLLMVGAYFVCPTPAQTQTCFPKAEAKMLVFKRGSFSSVPSSETVKGDEQAEYSFDARRKQKVTIHITAQPKNSVLPQVVGPPDDCPPQKLQKKSATDWTFGVPQTGDYTLSVLRNGASPGKTRFTVVVTIR